MLLRTIETFLRQTGLPATKFGRLAACDPRLVIDLRNGREPRKPLVRRLEHFMNTYNQQQLASGGGELRNAR